MPTRGQIGVTGHKPKIMIGPGKPRPGKRSRKQEREEARQQMASDAQQDVQEGEGESNDKA